MKTQTKLDLYKENKAEYAATKKPALIKTKPANYLAIEGQGAPGGERFSACIGALYGVAFTMKMSLKFAGGQDYAVSKLESLWWCDSKTDFSKTPKDKWQWKLLIRTPDFIKPADLNNAVALLLKRGKAPEVKEVKLEKLTEGDCVQILHVGPYDKMCESIALMQELAEKKGLKFDGRHHEVYLSDPRRVEPERLKTILRHPVTA